MFFGDGGDLSVKMISYYDHTCQIEKPQLLKMSKRFAWYSDETVIG